MLTPQRILKRYEEGYVTGTGLIMDVLRLTDERAVVEALELLPEDILEELKEFVGCYTLSTKIFNGPHPAMQTVQFVKEWLVRRASTAPPTRSARVAEPKEPTPQKKVGAAEARGK